MELYSSSCQKEKCIVLVRASGAGIALFTACQVARVTFFINNRSLSDQRRLVSLVMMEKYTLIVNRKVPPTTREEKEGFT